MKTQTVVKSANISLAAAIAASLAVISPLNAAPATIPSRYDEVSGKWIGDVDSLTNAIKNIAKNGEIILSRGEYDVSVLAATPMYGSSASSDYGVALLSVNGKSGVTIRGETGNPEDVVIDGKSCGIRVLALNGESSVLRDMTVKGGVAKDSCAPYNYRKGGGVLFASKTTSVSNCIFTACSSARGGGAVAGPNTVRGAVYNCKFQGNSTGAVGGGAIWGCTKVSGCTVVSNTANTANSASHGGGGIANCTTVETSTLAYNYAEGCGGGLYDCATVRDCIIEHNVAGEYVAADFYAAGGAYKGKFYRCKFRDNCAGSVALATYMENCEIVDGRISCRTNINCVIYSLHNSASHVWAIGNVKYPDGVSIRSRYGIHNVHLMRNCVITNCVWNFNNGTEANCALVCASSGRIENCTFADNAYYYLGRDINSGLTFENCALVRNTSSDKTTASDIPFFDSTSFCFSNCVWNVRGTWNTVVRDDAYADGVNQVLGAGVDPKFTGNGEYPYTPKIKSPLRENGMVLDWMADATDLAGNPRLRDSKVDVGAYQCWLTPKGMILSFR